MSDIHIVQGVLDGGYCGTTETFVHALEWFRDQGVDAVMIAGDMANFGMVEELQLVADAWYRVFPEGRAPDGHVVEKVFVYGNHDFEGSGYADHAKRLYPDEKERVKHVLRCDFGKWWERIFHEPYAPIYRKTIRGYSFVGQHWDGFGWGENCRFNRLQPLLDKIRGELDPGLPFFYVQHPHPRDTCYGTWAWGHDVGHVTKALSAFPNAVAFSGHSHYSLTDERSIWQGAFTSVGAGSLRYTGTPEDELPPAGYENSSTEGRNAWKCNAVKMMGVFDPQNCRQGMLWSVYDDCIAVKRREFLSDLDLGDDWIMPLPAAEGRPFAFAEHARRLRAPEFVAGGRLEVKAIRSRNRGGAASDGKLSIPGIARDAFRVTAPALSTEGARGLDMEFVAEARDGTRRTKYVIIDGFNQAAVHPKAGRPTSCVFAKDELPGGPVRFTATPRNSFHQRGRSLAFVCAHEAGAAIRPVYNANAALKADLEQMSPKSVFTDAKGGEWTFCGLNPSTYAIRPYNSLRNGGGLDGFPAVPSKEPWVFCNASSDWVDKGGDTARNALAPGEIELWPCDVGAAGLDGFHCAAIQFAVPKSARYRVDAMVRRLGNYGGGATVTVLVRGEKRWSEPLVHADGQKSCTLEFDLKASDTVTLFADSALKTGDRVDGSSMGDAIGAYFTVSVIGEE